LPYLFINDDINLSATKEKKPTIVIGGRKKRKQNPFQKRDCSGTYHLSIEKVQDYE
jgi:hypothetical protein